MDSVRIEHTSISRALFVGAGVLKTLCVSANGGASNCQIYDVIDATGDLKFDIGQLDGSGLAPPLGVGVQFYRGVYVVCGDANIKVTVGYVNDDI